MKLLYILLQYKNQMMFSIPVQDLSKNSKKTVETSAQESQQTISKIGKNPLLVYKSLIIFNTRNRQVVHKL